MKWMLGFLLISAHAFAAAPFPKLGPLVLTQIPCSVYLARATQVEVENLSPEQAADEYEMMLSLRHPLVVQFLQYHYRYERDFRPRIGLPRELRLLALIYGDQIDFDLREYNGESRFAKFKRLMRGWYLQLPSLRAETARRFVATVADIEWEFDQNMSPDLIGLNGFQLQHAFRFTTEDEMLLTLPRRWELNDAKGIALNLHVRIYNLRHRLRSDAKMQARLEQRLRWALPKITQPLRAYLSGLQQFIGARPDSFEELIRRFKQDISTARARLSSLRINQ